MSESILRSNTNCCLVNPTAADLRPTNDVGVLPPPFCFLQRNPCTIRDFHKKKTFGITAEPFFTKPINKNGNAKLEKNAIFRKKLPCLRYNQKPITVNYLLIAELQLTWCFLKINKISNKIKKWSTVDKLFSDAEAKARRRQKRAHLRARQRNLLITATQSKKIDPQRNRRLFESFSPTCAPQAQGRRWIHAQLNAKTFSGTTTKFNVQSRQEIYFWYRSKIDTEDNW